MKKLTAFILFMALALPLRALADDASKMATLYKDPNCGCCQDYADYLRDSGYEVTVVATENLSELRRERGIRGDLAGCHMTLIDGYVVEGHVPVDMINRLLGDRPDIKGISLPGMPMGSPGMSGQKSAPFTVLEIAAEKPNDAPRVYGVE